MKAKIYKTNHLSGHLDPPSSKNYTTRYMLVSGMARGDSVLRMPAQSDDSMAMRNCLTSVGVEFEDGLDECGKILRIRGVAGQPTNPGVINPSNAGAVLRFMMGIAAKFDKVRFETDFSESLGKRPHGDLLQSLTQLGVDTSSNNGKLPITLRGGSLRGGRISVSGASSSQYLSSLLFLAPLIGEDIEIEVRNGLVSKPLVRTTLEVMERAGIVVEFTADLLNFSIAGGQNYSAGDFTINGDYPSVAAIFSAGSVVGGDFTVGRLFLDSQGEQSALALLEKMGCKLERSGNQVRFGGVENLQSVEFDGDKATDAVLALVAASAFAEGESRFYGIENLRLKECDRISTPVNEFRRLGIECREDKNEIIVRGNPDGYRGGLEVETHHDHRIAQMLTIVGLGCHDGLTILNAENVNKSYPDFFADLISLGANIELE